VRNNIEEISGKKGSCGSKLISKKERSASQRY